MTTATLPRLLAAAAIGVVYYWANITVLGYVLVGNPIQEILLDLLARRGHLAAYRVSISLHDVVKYLILALPFAAAFQWIPALRNWTYVLLAAATAVILVYASTIWEELPLLIRYWGFWFGFSLVALSLPVAFALLNKIRVHVTPSSEFRDAA